MCLEAVHYCIRQIAGYLKWRLQLSQQINTGNLDLYVPATSVSPLSSSLSMIYCFPRM